jgi:transcriptional regulator with XRE-family HTH domain
MTKKPGELPASAEWVRNARGKLRQKDFAKRLGVHPVTVSKWENGASAPDWDSAQRIRKEFPGVPAAPGIFPDSVAQRLDGRPRTLEAAEIAALVDTMAPQMRAYVRDTVYRILSSQVGPPPAPAPSGPDGDSSGSPRHRR